MTRALPFRSLLVVGLICLTGLAAFADDVPMQFKAPAFKPPQENLPAVFGKSTPDGIQELKAMQQHLDKVVEKVKPAVVCVRIGPAFGSGIIVSMDGYVLTAGHVSGKPDQDVTLYFHDGKTAKGKTLGGNHGIDSGMIKITTEGVWPFVEMGDSDALKTGQWCFVSSHPGGYKTGRPPVIRLGRLLKVGATTLVSDCILVGGDSGGPLFDMHGRVIGINSRIGESITANMHVSVNPFRESWEKQAKGEVWGGKLGGSDKGGFAKRGPWLGVQTRLQGDDCIIEKVLPDSPAEKAGLKADDVIRKFDGKDLSADNTILKLVQQRKAGDRIVLEIQRGEETLALKLELGKR